VGESGGGDDSRLRGSEGHFTYTVSSTLETVLMSRPTTVYSSSDAMIVEDGVHDITHSKNPKSKSSQSHP